MIISICGGPGSGKSTVAKLVAELLKFKYYSIGDLRGKMALERGMNIDELNALGEREAFTDNDVDEFQRGLGQKEDCFVVEGRTSFYFIPHSFKVALKVDARVSAERIFSAPKRPDEKEYTSVDEVMETAQKRVESDKRRYQKYYRIDYTDEKNYDLVIDTTMLTQEQVCERIITEAERRKTK